MNRSFWSGIPFLLAAMGGSLSLAETKPNVLFIAIDDLRPALACYGDAAAITPHIDSLAARGTLFRRAYCQQAVCSPSRLSLLSGRRPDTIRVWDLKTHFRDALPDLVTLPQHFKNHGYRSRSIGKIYHGSGAPAKDPPSWSDPPLFDHERDASTRYATPENRKGKGLKRASMEAAEVSDETYVDGLVCEAALKALDDFKGDKQPFFLAVGFRKPHLPFCAPKKYWDKHTSMAPPVSTGHPQGAPELAVRSWGELEGYSDIPNEGRIDPEKTRALRHGYYACVTYIDALVGRLLDRLDSLGLAGNTIVCLWGDHGFHLGEQGLWTKANNYELSTRVPLIVVAPGHTPAVTDALVELVDVYPSLSDLAGLPAPEGMEGLSFKPLLENPGQAWKTAAFSQYPRARESKRHSGAGEIMGRSLRTARHLYVEWRENETGTLLATELYDHDTDHHETRNLASDPAQADLIHQLQLQLKAGWQAAQP